MTEFTEPPPSRSLLERILHLEAGEVRSILPFFSLYLILFLGLTLIDGLSLALFVQRVGAAQLPACYALTAVLNLFGVGGYLWGVRNFGSVRIFQGILAGSAALSLLVWGVDRFLSGSSGWYALLFVTREVSYTLVLMHFGAFLLDFFDRQQLNRVLPIIYAGGRVGGIAGGAVLQNLTTSFDLLDLVLVVVGLFCAAIAMLAILNPAKPLESEIVPPREPDTGTAAQNSNASAETANELLEREATASVRGFLRFVWRSPMMYWMTILSVLFVATRWILNYQYSRQFETDFDDAASMARFLGQYTQIALLFSLVLQLVLISRMVTWIGLRGAHMVYAGLVLTAFCGNLVWMTFPVAVFSRFVETELRFGLRNPVNQLLLNLFPKPVRVTSRVWTLGILIPIATLATAALLSQVPVFAGAGAIAWLGLAAGIGYVFTSIKLFDNLREASLEPARSTNAGESKQGAPK